MKNDTKVKNTLSFSLSTTHVTNSTYSKAQKTIIHKNRFLKNCYTKPNFDCNYIFMIDIWVGPNGIPIVPTQSEKCDYNRNLDFIFFFFILFFIDLFNKIHKLISLRDSFLCSCI